MAKLEFKKETPSLVAKLKYHIKQSNVNTLLLIIIILLLLKKG